VNEQHPEEVRDKLIVGLLDSRQETSELGLII